MRLILEGFWDSVRMRQGWSSKIRKWQWISLQIIIPIVIILPFMLWMVVKFYDYTLKQAVIFMFVFFPVMALFNSGEWNKDQKKVIENEVRHDH